MIAGMLRGARLLLPFQHELVVADHLADRLLSPALSLFPKLRHIDLRSRFCSMVPLTSFKSRKSQHAVELEVPPCAGTLVPQRRQYPLNAAGFGNADGQLYNSPDDGDVRISNAIAAHTDVPAEHTAEALTWGADEHVLMALAAGWWVYSRGQRGRQRIAADHVLIATLLTTALPHVLKTIFDQPRPDRLTVRGHWRGIPLSGNSMDAFSSGHALHIGALASAASELPSRERNFVWLIGAGLVATRVLLLAHWTSDVLAGLAIGSLTERLLRRLTGYGQSRPPAVGQHP